MPCDENYWVYYNFDRGQFLGPAGYGQSGKANDINIQCIGNLQQGNFQCPTQKFSQKHICF